MQKLINLRNNRGSALTGAVAICVILGIGIAGLMGVSRNTASMGADEHDDARLFLAAESGLLMLTDWVALDRGRTIAAAASGNGIPLKLNGVDVTVRITQPAYMPTDANWLITSTASLPEQVSYAKTLEWVVGIRAVITPEPMSPGSKGAVFNTSGTGKGMTGVVIDGPVHTNSHIYVYNENCKDCSNSNFPIFKGPVTVFESPNKPMSNLENISMAKLPDGRNFTYGVSSGSDKKVIGGEDENLQSALSYIFRDEYSYEGTYMRPDIDHSGFNTTLSSSAAAANGVPTGSWVIELPVNTASNAVNELTFGVDANDNPFYTFSVKVGGGEPTTTTVKYNPNAQLILYADANLTVKDGVMGGRVTVETAPGKDIIINLGNGNGLAYYWAPTVADFNKNYEGKSDVLAFYSGGNIELHNGNSSGNIVLTAQLFTDMQNNNFTIKSNSSDKTVNFTGTASVGEFWCLDGQGSGSHETLSKLSHDPRGLRAPGTIMKGCDNSGKNCVTLDVNGIPIVGSGGPDDIDPSANFFLPKFSWKETNNAI
ncbi:MAG: pilus assembly PilX N-terminal domain-containing protein [Chitinispirillales bacterium]|jgi:hypothetical protein|nr:pilus assembly PilX N-terminal domain-containing protein [Chitinispirillales bacterium]